MRKSNKRIKFEQEIFSTSIQDIEQMFAGSWSDVDQDELRPRKISSNNLSAQNMKSYSGVFPGPKRQTGPNINNIPPVSNFTGQLSMPPKDTSDAQLAYSSPPLHRLDLPAGTELRQTVFDYDCINMSLFSEAQSEDISNYIPSQPPKNDANEYALLSHQVLFNLNDDLEDYVFELDLKPYSPRVNLESDLNMIDVLITRPLSVMN